jgi:nicotinate-nucleotide pyrophosphorylase (carboxylating)
MEKQIRDIIEAALAEDIGTGDITTQAIVCHKKKGRAQTVAKDDFVIAGIDVFAETFQLLDKRSKLRN